MAGPPRPACKGPATASPDHDGKKCAARVSGCADAPSKPRRQDVFIRALLRHLPEVEVHFSHFLTHQVREPLAHPVGEQRTADVIRTEEKGSDVNLAVQPPNDRWLDSCDYAVESTNGSAIAEAIRLVRQHHDQRIGLVAPETDRLSCQFIAHADFARHIRSNASRRSQLVRTWRPNFAEENPVFRGRESGTKCIFRACGCRVGMSTNAVPRVVGNWSRPLRRKGRRRNHEILADGPECVFQSGASCRMRNARARDRGRRGQVS